MPDFATLTPRDARHAEAAAGMILSLDSPGDFARINAAVDQLIDRDPRAYYRTWRPSETEVGGVYIRGGTAAYCALSGVNVNAQLLRLINSWLSGGRNLGDYPILGYALTMANAIIASETELRDNLSNGNTHRIGFAGHSFGGLVALSLARWAKQTFPRVEVTYCSFGSPRGYLTPGSLFLNGFDMARWTTDDDPVPALPPRFGNARVLFGLVDSEIAENLEVWVQPVGTLRIRPNSVISALETDFEPQDITIPDLRALVNSREYGFFGPGHRIESYYTLIRRFNQSVANPPTPPVVPVTRPRAPAPPTPQARAEARQAANALIEVGREQNGIAVEIPKPARMRAVRRGRVWYVTWLGREIAIGPTRKKTQAIARHFNRFLRIYQSVGVSNSIDFLGALQDWLRDAANPEAGYRPTLEDAGMTP